MSYQSQDLLGSDPTFQGRNRSVCTQQAMLFKDDQRGSFKATANAILTDDVTIQLTFIRLAASGPGIADKADNGDGTIDQAKVTDDDLLSLTQANWPTVAALYFSEDGSPINAQA